MDTTKTDIGVYVPLYFIYINESDTMEHTHAHICIYNYVYVVKISGLYGTILYIIHTYMQIDKYLVPIFRDFNLIDLE